MAAAAAVAAQARLWSVQGRRTSRPPGARAQNWRGKPGAPRLRKKRSIYLQVVFYHTLLFGLFLARAADPGPAPKPSVRRLVAQQLGARLGLLATAAFPRARARLSTAPPKSSVPLAVAAAGQAAQAAALAAASAVAAASASAVSSLAAAEAAQAPWPQRAHPPHLACAASS